jgi:acyl carrier protein
MASWVLTSLCLLGIGILGYLLDWFQIRKVTKPLLARNQLTPTEFGNQFFGESSRKADIAAEVLQILARETPLDTRRLRRDDDLYQLKAFEFESLSSAVFWHELEKRFGLHIQDSSFKDLHTISQIVSYIETHTAETK